MNSLFCSANRRRASTLAAIAGAGALLALGTPASAQMINYNEQLAVYKDNRDSGVKVTDVVTPGVAARARVARAINQNQVVNEAALLQPDGTLKLPQNQTNLVVRTDYGDVRQGADGVVRIASPSIQGNVTGNVTLLVDGQGVRNITVLNNPR
ncbi:MAG: hypothetical protein ABI589_01455 [Burkholderiales bacterium]